MDLQRFLNKSTETALMNLRTLTIALTLVLSASTLAVADDPMPMDGTNAFWVLPKRFLLLEGQLNTWKHTGVLEWFISYYEYKPDKTLRPTLIKELTSNLLSKQYEADKPASKVFKINGLSFTRYRFSKIDTTDFGTWVNGVFVKSSTGRNKRVSDTFYLSAPKGEVQFDFEDVRVFDPEGFEKMEIEVLGSVRVK